jgi:exodeoxyribonuclease V alpha subunit
MSPPRRSSSGASPPPVDTGHSVEEAPPNTGDLFDAVPPASAVPPVSPLPPASPVPSAPPVPPTPPVPANTAALLRTLKAWSEQGWLRRLDSAFAGFMLDLSPDEPPSVVMASALVAHMEWRGHSCLSIDGLLREPEGLLGWGTEAAAEFRTVSAVFAFDPDDWLDALRRSPLVMVDDLPSQPSQPSSPDANRPLVLRGEKLYLRRYWRYERQVATRVLQRATTAASVDEEKARQWLGKLFPAAGQPIASVDWQKVACAVALRSGLTVITGGPGTGKTYTAARLLALLLALDPQPERLRIAVAAPTGKAAARLKQSIDSALQELHAKVAEDLPLASLVSGIAPAGTLHRLLGARSNTRKFHYDAANQLEMDLVIVDEASMIHLEMMAALLEALPARSRLILLGDKDQLASVEAGAVLGELCRDAEWGRYRPETAAFVESVTGQQIPTELLSDGPPLAQQTVMLRTSRRFGDRIGQLALAANAGDVKRASALLRVDDRAEDGADRGADDGAAGGKANRRVDGAANGTPQGEPIWLDVTSPEAVVKLAVQGRPDAPGGYGGAGGYLSLLRKRPTYKDDLLDAQAFENWAVSVLQAFERFRVLCAVHEGEWGTRQLNSAIERALFARKLIDRSSEWYEGRPIMVTRNDVSIRVFNGDIGIVLLPMNAAATKAPPRVYFLEGASLRSVGVSRLAHVETAYALTVHKSQGSEFDHTVLVLPRAPSRVLTRELVYTGITRAKNAFTLVTGRREAFAEALGQRTRRSSGLLELLDPGAGVSGARTPSR